MRNQSRSDRYINPSASARWGFLVLCLLVLASSLAWGQPRSYRISRFNDNITVSEDGSATVEEQITFAFVGSYKGIHRRIPVQYPDPKTLSNYTLYLDHYAVTDDAGNKLKFETKSVDLGRYTELTIYIPGAENAAKTVNITYIVRNGLRFSDNLDEFYWNVTGNDWTVPIDSASAMVTFPATAADKLKAQVTTGAYGSKERNATAEVHDYSVSFETTSGLAAREGMTIDIAIEKGVLTQPSGFTRLLRFLGSNLILLLPIISFAVMFTMWWTMGRNPDPGMSVAPLYEPPKGMTPSECGTLIDDSVDPRDITSTLVDLAVRGYVKIEESVEKVLFFKNKDFIFHLLKPPAEWADLASFEVEILNNMFPPPSQMTSLSSLKNRFYLAMPSIKEEVLSALKDKGLYRIDPSTAHGYLVMGALLSAAPFVIAQVTGMYNFLRAPVMLIIAGALAIIPVFFFGRKMSAKTLKGMRALIGVQGFKEFMVRVDGDRLRKFPPDTFEKYLPYAMALGVESHWAKAFEGIIQNPPNWYVGSGPNMMFNPILFAANMGHMTNSAYEAFTAAPQASASGSGFGGGGGGGDFSGGGFGGGGGDAF